jgi:hypothetical protein
VKSLVADACVIANETQVSKEVSRWGWIDATPHLQIAIGGLARGLLLGTGRVVGRLVRRPRGTVLQLVAERVERIDAGAGRGRLFSLLSRTAGGTMSCMSRGRRRSGAVRGLDVACRSRQCRGLLLLGRLEQKGHLGEAGRSTRSSARTG